jgi:hypothetical protein
MAAIGGEQGARRMPWMLVAVLAGVAVASLLLWWPGVVMYDTVRQYEQALGGSYDDWHPPVMARLMGLLLTLHLGACGPLLLLQLGLYWIGIGLLAVALVRSGARRAGWAMLLAGLSPLVVDWMPVIVKDAQMAGAMVGATGLVGWYRLQGRPLPRIVGALVVLLLVYAALLRANAVFAVVPLALAVQGWAGVRHWWTRAALMLGCTLMAIGVSGVVNHRLMGAERSHVERTQAIFDLAGIAHFAGLKAMPGVPEPLWTDAERRHCYKPFYWDSYTDPAQCGAIGQVVFNDGGPSPIMREWAFAIVRHPLAYAEHRLAHLNAAWRIAGRYDEHGATAPGDSEPNPYGLGLKGGPHTHAMQQWAALAGETPLGSPGVWLVVAAAIGWLLLGTPRQPARELGLALVLSAMLMTASFAVVSIASDLRYHLWSMAATGLAAALLAGCRGIDRRRLRWALGVIVAVVLASALARGFGAPFVR